MDQHNSSDADREPKRRVIRIGSQRNPQSGEEVAETPVVPEVMAVESAPQASADPPEELSSPASPPDRMTPVSVFPPPRVQRISDELQREIEEALAGSSLDELLAGKGGHVSRGPEPEFDSRYRAMVTKIHRDNVFVALPAHYEGVVPLRSFAKTPNLGDVVDVIVSRAEPEDGLYPLRLAGAAVDVGDWSDLTEGAVIEVRVAGHNAGGLECEVNQIRGFIPISQVSLYRVEDLAQFVGERLMCVVTEVNPSRGNLVLSRRAVLERERAEARQGLLDSLQPGQVREGVVRSVRDFGAFVDLGGVDGLIHVSKLSWDRIGHPQEVVEEGQRVKVKVEKVDPVTGRISLSYRDLMEQPWAKALEKYPVNSVVTGTVTRLTDFGAFVRLDAGIEGLVHISELAHHRVSRVSSVVQSGQVVQVKVLSIDPDEQRMSLSIKAATSAKAAPALVEDTEPVEEESEAAPGTRYVSTANLKGGINRRTGGDRFGLKW